MAYYRTSFDVPNTVLKGSSGAGTAASMPNTGITVIANTSGEAWVLQPPVAGCKKRVVFTGLTSANVNILRASTSGDDVIAFMGATTGINTLTLSTMSGQFPLVIDLVGFNSTSWLITNVFPQTTAVFVVPSSA